MSQSVTINSPADLPAAANANLSDILAADQVNPGGGTFTTRGLTLQQMAQVIAPLVQGLVVAGSGAQPVIPASSAALLGPPSINGGPLATIALGVGLALAGGALGLEFGTAAGTAAAGNDSRITGALQASAVGAANGVAPLVGGLVPLANLPSGIGAVSSVAGRTGAVTLSAADISGLGTLATQGPGTGLSSAGGVVSVSYGTAAGTAAAGNDGRITGALQAANNFSDVASAATARTNLGLGTLATQGPGTGLSSAGGVVSVSYGTAAGTAAAGNDGRITGALQAANNFSDVASAATARTNLGLGTLATQGPGTGLSSAGGVVSVSYGTAAGTAAAGNDGRITGALQAANNFSDVASAATARTNLGLGTLATQAASGVAITGGTIVASVSGATALSSYTGSTTAMTLAARAGLLPAVQDYGLTMNGSTDDSAAWNAMETALPTGSTILVTGSIHAPSYAPNTTKAFLYDFVGPVSGGTVMTGFDQVGSTVQFFGDGATVNNFVSSGHQAGVQFNRQNISSTNYGSVVGVHQYADNTNTGTATTFIASGVTGPNNGGSLYVSGAYLNSYGTSPSGGGSIAHTVYVNKYYGSTENLWGEWLHFTDLSGFGSSAGLGGSYASERDFTPNGYGLPNSTFVDNDAERKHMLLKVHSHLTSVWTAGATVKAGANYTASSSANPFFGYLVTCTTAGTTGSTEPTWPSLPYPGSAQTVTDGTVVWTWNGTIVAGTVETILQLACDTSNGIQSGQMTTPANTARHILIKGQNYGAGIDFTPFVPIASPNADASAAFNVAAIRLAYNVLDFGGNGTLNGMNNLVLAGNSTTGNLELRSGTGNVAPTVQSILQKNGGATFNNTVTVTAGGLVIAANGLQVNGGVTQIGSAGATIAGGGLQINGGTLSGLTASFSGNLTANTLTASSGLTVTTGGITISGGTLNGSVGNFSNGFSVGTLTATAGGVNVTAGGVAITAGGLQVNGGVITGSAASLTGNLTANTLTASAGLTVTAGGLTISAGVLNGVTGAFSGAVTGATATAGDNSTKLATTAFVSTAVSNGVTGLAALASPAFTGTPSAPTAAANTNTTQIATTAFYCGQAATVAPVIDGTAAVGVSLLFARQDHVHPTDTSRAALASPALTGTPTAPTAAGGTATTQIATTAFVTTAAANLAPKVSPSFTGGATVGGGLTVSSGGLTITTGGLTISGGIFQLSNAYTTGAPTAGGYVVIQDSTGRTTKLLAA